MPYNIDHQSSWFLVIVYHIYLPKSLNDLAQRIKDVRRQYLSKKSN